MKFNVVTDLSNSFNPYPKSPLKDVKKETKSGAKNVKDFCIMPKSTKYSTVRTEKYYERHEVFFGKAYRQKSIRDGLIVFLTRESHRGTNGVHGKNGDKFNRYLKQKGKEAWIKYYNKTEDEFRKEYGKIDIKGND